MKLVDKIVNKFLSHNDAAAALEYSACYSFLLGKIKQELKVTLENYNASMPRENAEFVKKLNVTGEELLRRQINATALTLGISYTSKVDALEEKISEFSKHVKDILAILLANNIRVFSLDIFTIATGEDSATFTYKANPLVLPKEVADISKLDLTSHIEIDKL